MALKESIVKEAKIEGAASQALLEQFTEWLDTYKRLAKEIDDLQAIRQKFQAVAAEVAEPSNTQVAAAAKASETVSSPPTDPIAIEKKANAIINNYSLWAAGAGVLPIPFLDIAGIAVAQGKMLDDLATTYGKGGFQQNFAQNLLTIVVASFGPELLFAGGLGTVLKFVPIIGLLPAGGAVSAIGATSTYVVGKVVQEQFQSGLSTVQVQQLLENPATVQTLKSRALQFAQEFMKKKAV